MCLDRKSAAALRLHQSGRFIEPNRNQKRPNRGRQSQAEDPSRERDTKIRIAIGKFEHTSCSSDAENTGQGQEQP